MDGVSLAVGFLMGVALMLTVYIILERDRS